VVPSVGVVLEGGNQSLWEVVELLYCAGHCQQSLRAVGYEAVRFQAPAWIHTMLGGCLWHAVLTFTQMQAIACLALCRLPGRVSTLFMGLELTILHAC
jgi:hypothetical protein